MFAIMKLLEWVIHNKVIVDKKKEKELIQSSVKYRTL